MYFKLHTLHRCYRKSSSNTYSCSVMLREKLMHISFDDTSLPCAKLTDDQNLVQVLFFLAPGSL